MGKNAETARVRRHSACVVKSAARRQASRLVRSKACYCEAALMAWLLVQDRNFGKSSQPNVVKLTAVVFAVKASNDFHVFLLKLF